MMGCRKGRGKVHWRRLWSRGFLRAINAGLQNLFLIYRCRSQSGYLNGSISATLDRTHFHGEVVGHAWGSSSCQLSIYTGHRANIRDLPRSFRPPFFPCRMHVWKMPVADDHIWYLENQSDLPSVLMFNWHLRSSICVSFRSALLMGPMFWGMNGSRERV